MTFSIPKVNSSEHNKIIVDSLTLYHGLSIDKCIKHIASAYKGLPYKYYMGGLLVCGHSGPFKVNIYMYMYNQCMNRLINTASGPARSKRQYLIHISWAVITSPRPLLLQVQYTLAYRPTHHCTLYWQPMRGS